MPGVEALETLSDLSDPSDMSDPSDSSQQRPNAPPCVIIESAKEIYGKKKAPVQATKR
jgi:hypothetical protein